VATFVTGRTTGVEGLALLMAVSWNLDRLPRGLRARPAAVSVTVPEGRSSRKYRLLMPGHQCK